MSDVEITVVETKTGWKIRVGAVIVDPPPGLGPWGYDSREAAERVAEDLRSRPEEAIHLAAGILEPAADFGNCEECGTPTEGKRCLTCIQDERRWRADEERDARRYGLR